MIRSLDTEMTEITARREKEKAIWLANYFGAAVFFGCGGFPTKTFRIPNGSRTDPERTLGLTSLMRDAISMSDSHGLDLIRPQTLHQYLKKLETLPVCHLNQYFFLSARPHLHNLKTFFLVQRSCKIFVCGTFLNIEKN